MGRKKGVAFASLVVLHMWHPGFISPLLQLGRQNLIREEQGEGDRNGGIDGRI